MPYEAKLPSMRMKRNNQGDPYKNNDKNGITSFDGTSQYNDGNFKLSCIFATQIHNISERRMIGTTNHHSFISGNIYKQPQRPLRQKPELLLEQPPLPFP